MDSTTSNYYVDMPAEDGELGGKTASHVATVSRLNYDGVLDLISLQASDANLGQPNKSLCMDVPEGWGAFWLCPWLAVEFGGRRHSRSGSIQPFFLIVPRAFPLLFSSLPMFGAQFHWWGDSLRSCCSAN